MRSNNPKATRFLLRRHLYIAVIVFFIAFSILPFWGLSHIPNELPPETTMNYSPQERAERIEYLVSEQVFNSQWQEMLAVVFGGLGFLSALMLMRHLFNRRRAMLHAALPDRRGADLLRRCVAYLALGFAPIMLNMLLYIGSVAVNGVLAYVNWGELLSRFGVLLLCNLYGFAMGLLCSVLTGREWAAVLLGGVLIAGAEAMVFLWEYIAGQYLHTLSGETTAALLRLSPAYTLYKGIREPENFTWIPSVLAFFAALGLSFGLYRVRRTEAVERTLAFGWLQSVLSLTLPMLGGTLIGMIVLSSCLTELSMIVGMIAGTALTYWVCRIVFQQRFCGIAKRWYLPAVSALVLMLGVIVLRTDLLGFDHYLPERDKLTTITYRPQFSMWDEQITLTNPDALDAAYEWCTLMRDEADGLEDRFEGSDFSSTAVTISYQLGSRTVYRLYPNDSARTDAQSALQRVLESEDYQQSLIRETGLDAERVQQIYLYSPSYGAGYEQIFKRFGVYGSTELNRKNAQDGALISKWVEALQADILSRTMEEKQRDALFELSIGSVDPQTGDTQYKSLFVYPDDEHFLKEVFGDQMQAIVDYATGGYAADENIVVLRVDFPSRDAYMEAEGENLREVARSVREAADSEEAKRWIQNAREYGRDCYYQPEIRTEPYSLLYVYRMDELENDQGWYGYTIPEDKTQLFERDEFPAGTILEMVKE